MKGKEVIRLLQEADPTGEIEVCVGNVDIFTIDKLPAYYDGKLQVLVRDPNAKYYPIIGGKYVSSGWKVSITPMSITDALENDPENFTVDYSGLSERDQQAAKKGHEEARQAIRDLEQRLEREYFRKWVKEEAEKLTPDTEKVEGAADEFFDQHVSRNDPLPPGGSYVEARKRDWAARFEVWLNQGFPEVRVR